MINKASFDGLLRPLIISGHDQSTENSGTTEKFKVRTMKINKQYHTHTKKNRQISESSPADTHNNLVKNV